MADIIGIPVALSGIFLMIVGYGMKECGTGDCERIRADPAEQPRWVAVFLLCAVSLVPSSLPCLPLFDCFDRGH